MWRTTPETRHGQLTWDKLLLPDPKPAPHPDKNNKKNNNKPQPIKNLLLTKLLENSSSEIPLRRLSSRCRAAPCFLQRLLSAWRPPQIPPPQPPPCSPTPQPNGGARSSTPAHAARLFDLLSQGIIFKRDRKSSPSLLCQTDATKSWCLPFCDSGCSRQRGCGEAPQLPAPGASPKRAASSLGTAPRSRKANRVLLLQGKTGRQATSVTATTAWAGITAGASLLPRSHQAIRRDSPPSEYFYAARHQAFC